MKVDEMIPGQLYRANTSCVYMPMKFAYFKLSENAPRNIKRVTIIKDQKISHDNNPCMLYLGYTREKWSINNISKHHWFLVDGDKIVLNNNCFSHLEHLDGL